MDYPLLNETEALSRFGGNTMILKSLLKKFPSMATPLYEGLQTSIDQNNLVEAEHAIHTIKGTAGNLSLTALFQIATTFDTELKDNAFKSETYEEFKQIFNQTLSYVNEYIA